MLFSPVVVDSVLTCLLVTLRLSTLIDSVVSLMAFSLSSMMGLVVDSVLAGKLSACWSSTICRISNSTRWVSPCTTSLSMSKETFLQPFLVGSV